MAALTEDPEYKLFFGPEAKIFLGKVLTTSPKTQEEAWKLEQEYAARHPDAKASGDRSWTGLLSIEDRKRFLLELWNDVISPAGREAILAAKHDSGKIGPFRFHRPV